LKSAASSKLRVSTLRGECRYLMTINPRLSTFRDLALAHFPHRVVATKGAKAAEVGERG